MTLKQNEKICMITNAFAKEGCEQMESENNIIEINKYLYFDKESGQFA